MRIVLLSSVRLALSEFAFVKARTLYSRLKSFSNLCLYFIHILAHEKALSVTICVS